MILVDFTYYTEVYKGTVIPATSFVEPSQRASEYVESYVCQPVLPQHDDSLKRAVCRVAELIYTERNGRGAVVSETVGPHTVTYKNQGENLSFEARLDYAIRMYLQKTGLLYRGL